MYFVLPSIQGQMSRGPGLHSVQGTLASCLLWANHTRASAPRQWNALEIPPRHLACNMYASLHMWTLVIFYPLSMVKKGEP